MIPQFIKDNTQYYNFSEGNTGLVKNKNGSQECIFVNAFFWELESYTFRILQDFDRVEFGAVLDSPHITGRLLYKGWVFITYFGQHYRYGNYIGPFGSFSPTIGKNVTVRVNLAAKEISFQVNGVSTGINMKMNISDSDLLRLRPAVGMSVMGEALELIP